MVMVSPCGNTTAMLGGSLPASASFVNFKTVEVLFGVLNRDVYHLLREESD